MTQVGKNIIDMIKVVKKVDYSKIDAVVGTHHKVFPDDRKKTCVDCGKPIYYHDNHPDDSAFIGLECFIKRMKKEEKEKQK
jgi:hypothetical protein